MQTITINIPGNPIPKQSARFSIVNNHIHKYQPKSITNNKNTIALTALAQLPKDFKPFSSPISASITFAFQPLKSFPKSKLQTLDTQIFHKPTKPDLDNLIKQLWDALQSIIFLNDSQIVHINARKIYSHTPHTLITFQILEN